MRCCVYEEFKRIGRGTLWLWSGGRALDVRRKRCRGRDTEESRRGAKRKEERDRGLKIILKLVLGRGGGAYLGRKVPVIFDN